MPPRTYQAQAPEILPVRCDVRFCHCERLLWSGSDVADGLMGRLQVTEFCQERQWFQSGRLSRSGQSPAQVQP